MQNGDYEIERKFLLKGDFREGIISSHRVVQGYLSRDNERIVRVRTNDNKGFITVKGRAEGIRRFEWEKEIDESEAKKLLALSLPHVVEKTRHIVLYRGQKFEVDEFHGANKGLIIAELELESEDSPFSLPEWIGEDVTSDPRYANSYLSEHPYGTW